MLYPMPAFAGNTRQVDNLAYTQVYGVGDSVLLAVWYNRRIPEVITKSMDKNDFNTSVLMEASRDHQREQTEGAFNTEERYPGEYEDSRDAKEDRDTERMNSHFEQVPW